MPLRKDGITLRVRQKLFFYNHTPRNWEVKAGFSLQTRLEPLVSAGGIGDQLAAMAYRPTFFLFAASTAPN